ncbi:NAD(P)H-dependent oxidoreductase [Thermoactinospora rubra]|uniref:NAD(P)H-dependent oxidoreductase n=1 Tax=Thermoactinospora rubra TaxID=1088767 RepID=UPI000A109048|nr:NAD(P)H-dependent oxidoreductase [Thermoactinospora rubra]
MERIRVAIIADRAGPGRALADRLADLACERGDLEADLLDLAVACLPCEGEGGGPCEDTPPQVRDLSPWLAAADAYVLVIPELAWFARELAGKPVVLAAPEAADLLFDDLIGKLRKDHS